MHSEDQADALRGCGRWPGRTRLGGSIISSRPGRRRQAWGRSRRMAPRRPPSRFWALRRRRGRKICRRDRRTIGCAIVRGALEEHGHLAVWIFWTSARQRCGKSSLGRLGAGRREPRDLTPSDTGVFLDRHDLAAQFFHRAAKPLYPIRRGRGLLGRPLYRLNAVSRALRRRRMLSTIRALSVLTGERSNQNAPATKNPRTVAPNAETIEMTSAVSMMAPDRQ
jgi:hypothetical protein